MPRRFNEKLANELTLHPLISLLTADCAFPSSSRALCGRSRFQWCGSSYVRSNSKALFCQWVGFPPSLISIEAVRLTSNTSYWNCRPVSWVALVKVVQFVTDISKMWRILKQYVMNLIFKISNANSLNERKCSDVTYIIVRLWYKEPPHYHLEPAYKGTNIRNKLQMSNKRIVLPSYQVLSLTSLCCTSRKQSNGCLGHIMCSE